MSNRLVLEFCFTSLLLLLVSEKSPIESKSLLSGAFVSFSGSSHCSLGIVSSSVSSWDSWKIAAEGCNDWELESFASLDDLTFSSIFRFLKGYYRTYEHFIKKASKTLHRLVSWINVTMHIYLFLEPDKLVFMSCFMWVVSSLGVAEFFSWLYSLTVRILWSTSCNSFSSLPLSSSSSSPYPCAMSAMGLEPFVLEFDNEGDLSFSIFSTCYNKINSCQYIKLMSSNKQEILNVIHAFSPNDLTTALAASLFFHENDLW